MGNVTATAWIGPTTDVDVFDVPSSTTGRVVGIEWDGLTIHVADWMNDDHDIVEAATLLIDALDVIRNAARERLSDVPMVHPSDIQIVGRDDDGFEAIVNYSSKLDEYQTRGA